MLPGKRSENVKAIGELVPKANGGAFVLDTMPAKESPR